MKKKLFSYKKLNYSETLKMNKIQKKNDNSFNSRNSSNNNKKDFSMKDNDDIIKQISQITPSNDKSFESSDISKNLPQYFEFKKDTNRLSKKSNISPFDCQESYKENNVDNSLINNKYLLLNQKLQYLCSIIQASNINIKKYDDLKEFSKYLYDNNFLLNYHEPIMILFDTISQLIFYIQRELKNNDILMSEIKRLKTNKHDNEQLIYQLKMTIKEKDKELNELKIIKKENYQDYQDFLNQINELKKENIGLYKKIDEYKLQIKKVKSNNQIIPRNINNFNNDKKKIHNNPHRIQCLNNIIKLNNSYDDTKYLRMNKYNTNFNLYNSVNKTINYKSFIIPLKEIINNKNISTNYNTYNIEKKDFKNPYIKLKQINNMLNKYNSSLDKIKLNNNNENNYNIKKQIINKGINIKKISNFLGKMDEKIKTMENCIKEYDKKEKINIKKMLKVNTSRWKSRKKVNITIDEKKNNSQQVSENSQLNLYKSNIYKKKLNMNEKNICFGYKSNQ